jgi:hypothetical protein
VQEVASIAALDAAQPSATLNEAVWGVLDALQRHHWTRNVILMIYPGLGVEAGNVAQAVVRGQMHRGIVAVTADFLLSPRTLSEFPNCW